jgi:hypothetical protein
MTHKHMKTTHGIGENIYKSHIWKGTYLEYQKKISYN